MNCFGGKFDGLELPNTVGKNEIISVTDDCKIYFTYRFAHLDGVGDHFVHFSDKQEGTAYFCSRFLCKDCGAEVATILKTPTERPICPKCNAMLK